MSAFPHKAMVMAAGLGTRMRPLTDAMPKPLVRVAGRALLDWTLDMLAASGIAEAVVNTHYLAPMIEAHVEGRATPRVRLSYESELLETGGGIRHALPLLGDTPFFSLNSDTICIDGHTPALRRLAAAWDDARMDALLLVHKVEDAVGYDGVGDFFVEADGRVRRRGAQARAPYVFTGVQLIHPRLFAGSPEGAFSLNKLYDRDLSRVCALVHDGGWLHVGDPAGLSMAEKKLGNA